MHEAAQTVIAKNGSAGIDGVSTKEFNDEYELNMRELYRQLQNGSYQPSPVLRVYIPKSDGSERPLGVPTVKDRIAQASVKEIIEPIYEEIFCDCSYGFRPGRSQIDAVNQVEEYREQGYKWVVDADIKGFFDNIDHELLIEFIREEITDGWVLNIIKSWLTAGVMTDGIKEPTTEGTPQGGVISPLLANIYLHQMDRILVKRGYKIVRFADDCALYHTLLLVSWKVLAFERNSK